MKYLLLVPLAVIAVVSSQEAGASETSLLDAIRACGKIKNNTERLSCFDAIAPIDTAGVTMPEPTLEQKKDAFGSQALKAREKSFAEANGESSQELDEATFKLLEAGKNRAGKFFFIMENGQVWRQLPADTGRVRIPKKLADVEVTIKRKLLGSHILILKGRSIKVKRLK